MNGTIEKTNKDNSINLISTPTSWLVEDAATGKIIDETNDYSVKDEWIKKYRLSRNVGKFWYKEDKVMNGYERNADSLNKIFNSHKSVKSSVNGLEFVSKADYDPDSNMFECKVVDQNILDKIKTHLDYDKNELQLGNVYLDFAYDSKTGDFLACNVVDTESSTWELYPEDIEDVFGKDMIVYNQSNFVTSSRRVIKLGVFSYTLEDVRDSINRYLERNVITKAQCKTGSPENIKQALIDLREVINNAIEQGTSINEDDVYEAQIVARDCLWAYNYNQFLTDIINPLLEVLNKDTIDTSDVQKQMKEGKKNFTPEEIDQLYEGIVLTGDDRFYKWLYEKYPWITEDNAMTMNLEKFMLQWIYETSGIYEEMREWLNEWN